MKMLDSLSVQAAAAGAVVAGLAGIAPGQLCPPEPVLVGGKFEISTGTGDVRDQPVVAYNGTSGEFLVAWFDNRNSGNIDIFARRVATDGTLPADAVEVSGAIGAQFDPALAYNSVDNEYLVAWRSQDGDQFTDPLWNNAIGVRLDGSGNRMGGDLPISAAGFEGSLVHSAASNSYFHLGRNFQGGGAEGIVSQLVSAGGALQGSRIDTATGAFPTPGPAGQAGYDSVNHRFLATWREQLLPRDLRGQLYDGATGGAVGASFRISDVFASGRDLAAGVAFDPGRGRFLVVFGQQ